MILDSSILVKLVLAEPGSREAKELVVSLLRDGYTLHTVDIALAESLNAVWKHVVIHKDLEAEAVRDVLEDLIRIYSKLGVLSTPELSEEAMEISLIHKIAVYDSLYIAAARKLGTTLYTADKRLHDESRGIASSRLLGSE